MRYLSQEWMDEANRTAQESEELRRIIQNLNLVVQQHVKGGPDGDVSYSMRIADGTIQVGLGQADSPQVTLTQDYETAAAIMKTELNPMAAFATGKLVAEGNMALLMQHQATFNNLNAVFESLRERTEF